MGRDRLDKILVTRGLVSSRARAQALIAAGEVEVDGKRADKASDSVAPAAQIRVLSQARYVSRGGDKLAGALRDLGVSVKDLTLADVGASTGGFTDCVLQAGARRVYALDVGRDQLHPSLREDARVVNMEGVNARALSTESLPERVDLVLVDASFIGLAKLLPALVTLLVPNGRVLCLVKPQFEVGPEYVGKRGVVRDDELRQRAVDEVARAGALLQLVKIAQVDCSMPGPEGNREIFLLLARQAGAV